METDDESTTTTQSKLERDLIAPTVLGDYLRERLKSIDGNRINISADADDKLLEVANTVLKAFLDQLAKAVHRLVVGISKARTVAPNHVEHAYHILSGNYTNKG